MKRPYRHWAQAEKQAAVAQMSVCGHAPSQRRSSLLVPLNTVGLLIRTPAAAREVPDPAYP